MSRRAQDSRCTGCCASCACRSSSRPGGWSPRRSSRSARSSPSRRRCCPSSVDFGAYGEVFELQPFAQQYLNSLYIAVDRHRRHDGGRVDWPGTRSPASGSPAQNVLFLVVLAGLLIPSEVTIVPLFQMFHRLGHDQHALAADPGADLRRAERAGDVHHAAVLHRPAGRAGGGRAASTGSAGSASSGGSRCRWPARRSARSRSSPSCTAGTSTSSRSSSCPRRRSSRCRRRSPSSSTPTAARCGTSSSPPRR